MANSKKGKKKIPPMPKVGESKYKPQYCQKLWEYFMTYEGPGIPQMSEFARSIPVALKTVRNWRNAHEDFGVVYQACMDYQQELLNNGGLTGTLNPRMVQFVLSANHKVREYTRINAEERREDSDMSAGDRRFLMALEERLRTGKTQTAIEAGATEMVNEGAVPFEELEDDEED